MQQGCNAGCNAPLWEAITSAGHDVRRQTHMSDSPSTTGANGRGGAGRFAPGNKLAKGNPHAKRVARLRAALLKAVSPADLREVIGALLTAAKGGDVPAARELLQRLL